MDCLELLFEPCSSKEELRLHIKAFLKIELPDCTVDEDSTTNPMEFVWAIYSMLLTNVGDTSHVVAASRNTAKTLTSAILHFYAMIHFRRTCLHLAATYDQSVSCINYLNKFLSIPELLPYSSTDNARIKSLSKLPANAFTNRSEAVLRIAIASVKGTNSQRCNFLILDELDLVPQAIISEVMFTLDPTPEGFEPVSVCLSSRKTNDGPVQSMIDDSSDAEKGIKLHKWSVADWIRYCPPDTHKPEQARKTALLNLDDLTVIWDPDQQAALKARGASQFKEINAYAGCEKCPAFIACQARAPKQTAKTKMLRSIKFVGDMLRKVREPGIIISQYLNLKPETTGIVYKTFTPHRHVKDYVRFYEWAVGEPFNPFNLPPEQYAEALQSKKYVDKRKITPTKDDIFEGMRQAGWDIVYGIDWGFSPAPAVCVVGAYNKRRQRACVLHVEYANGYDNRAWAEYCATNIWPRFPGEYIAPDMEDPASPSYFSKFRIPTVNTKPHLIATGVSQIRGFLWNVATQQSHFAVLDDGEEDSGNRRLISAFQKWTHKRTPNGFDFDRFEDDDYCDFLDPTRYMLAPFVKEMNVTIAAKQPTPDWQSYQVDFIAKLPPEQREQAARALAQNQLASYFSQAHGIKNVFDKEEQARALEMTRRFNGEIKDAPPDDSKEQRKAGIKLSF